jgi:uridylate kinase
MALKYTRALLKLSGEVLAGDSKSGIDFDLTEKICKHVIECVRAGAQIGLVVGGGNFWRGRSSGPMDAVRADKMGMLAIMMNALALEDAFAQLVQPALVQSACVMPQVAGCIDKRQALQAMAAGKVVIFGGGTGNPFFTTDSAAALRAAEIEADVILLAKKVDAVYSDDPEKNPAAFKYDMITHKEVLEKGLGVMDSTAASLCMDNNIPVHVFGLAQEGNILKAVNGEKIGTIVR